MPENLNPEHQLEELKALRIKYEEALSNAQKTGDYTEATKLKDELEQRLSALEALFPKQESKTEEIENEEFDELQFEKKTVNILKRYLEADKITAEEVLLNLVAMGSQEAMNLRDQAVIEMANDKKNTTEVTPALLRSYAGVDNKQSWRVRESHPDLQDDLLLSLAGLDSDRAWEIREDSIINTLLLQSLIGLDSEKAWAIRETELTLMGESFTTQLEILKSITGVDSEKAWSIRNSVNWDTTDFAPLHGLFLSLIGLDTERAWTMRAKLEDKAKISSTSMSEILFGYLAESLAGLDSERAWGFRSKLTNFDLNYSLAGLDNGKAWQVRNRLEIEVDDVILSKANLIENLNGGFITAIGWRTAKKYQKKEKEE